MNCNIVTSYGIYYHAAHADELMSKAAQLCFDDSNKPDVPTALSPLANPYAHADKNTNFLNISNE